MVWALDVEFEFDDVAVLHDIGFAFSAELAGGLDGLFGAELFQVIKIANAGGDESAFEIGVNGAGGLRRSETFFNGPGATFFFAGGEEGLEAECVIGGFDEFF